MAEVVFDTSRVSDWSTFHRYSAEIFGFPDFYGCNLNAWIDCLTYLPEGDGMCRFVLGAEEKLLIKVTELKNFAKEKPEICLGFLECVTAVNQRYISSGDIPRLILVLT